MFLQKCVFPFPGARLQRLCGAGRRFIVVSAELPMFRRTRRRAVACGLPAAGNSRGARPRRRARQQFSGIDSTGWGPYARGGELRLVSLRRTVPRQRPAGIYRPTALRVDEVNPRPARRRACRLFRTDGTQKPAPAQKQDSRRPSLRGRRSASRAPREGGHDADDPASSKAPSSRACAQAVPLFPGGRCGPGLPAALTCPCPEREQCCRRACASARRARI